MFQGLDYDIAQVMVEATDPELDQFPSLCTIQEPSGTLGSSGAPSGTYIAVSGLVDIPCKDGVETGIQATEARAMAEILAKGLRHVALNAYYSAVITGWRDGWQAVVDGTVYNILGVETDSLRTQTRLKLQLVTP
jgi:hypothetical protein